MTKPRSVERVLVVGDAEEGPAERVEVHDARGAVVLRREQGGSLLREQAGVDYHLLTDANGNRSLVEQGVTALNHYDPLGRLIRTDLPNGTFSRVAFDPWQQASWIRTTTCSPATGTTSAKTMEAPMRAGDRSVAAANLAVRGRAGVAPDGELDYGAREDEARSEFLCNRPMARPTTWM